MRSPRYASTHRLQSRCPLSSPLLTPGPHLLQVLKERALEPEVLRTFNAQGLANVAWAYSALDVHDDALRAALAARAMDPTVLLTLADRDLSSLGMYLAPEQVQLLHEAWAEATAGVAPAPGADSTRTSVGPKPQQM